MKQDNKNVFFDCLKTEFSPRLRAIGFQGSGQNFRRVNGEIINLINIQVHKYGGSCAVNLGLHLVFLPVCWTGQFPDLNKIKEMDCEFRKRLAPKNKTDYWWNYDSLFGSPANKAAHLIETYFTYGEQHFQQYDNVEKIGTMISLRDIKPGAYLPVFGGIIAERGALAMARVHRHLGDLAKAKEFASVGLSSLGKTVSLRPAFEEILNAR